MWWSKIRERSSNDPGSGPDRDESPVPDASRALSRRHTRVQAGIRYPGDHDSLTLFIPVANLRFGSRDTFGSFGSDWRCALSGASNRRATGGTGRGDRWREGREFHPSIALLVLGCVLLAAVAYQAHAAVRSHRATVDKLLTDYARAAEWNYARQTEAELGAVVEHLFHRALHGAPPDFDYPEPPPTRAIVHAPHAEDSCQFPDLGELADAARYSLREGSIDVLGTGVSPIEVAGASETIARAVRRGSYFRGREGLVGVSLEGRSMIAAYSRVRVRRDTMVYVLFLEPATLTGVLRRALGHGRLLPDPLVEGVPPERLLALRVEMRGSGEILSSSDSFPARYTARGVIDGTEGALEASVGLWPAAAEHLVIGGLPRSRLPLLLGLLALAMGLLAMAFLQLRREHELAAMRAGFVSSVSHELRTPLALQRVFLDTLRLGRADSEEGRAWALENIDRETQRLTNLVENVLRFAQAGEGRIELDPEPTDLSEEIARALSDYRPLAPDAVLELDACDGSPVVASVDRHAFRQVLFNLVENAVKYGPAEQRVRVGLTRADGRAVMTVDDEGPGIPIGSRRGIWEPFERAEAARRSGKGGSGIGLSVVRDLVALHRGSVSVGDSPAGGARFRIELPVADG